MLKGEVLEKSFVCKCQKARITIQMLPGRTVSVTCRLCNQVYEVVGKNVGILIEAKAEREKINNRGSTLRLVGD